MRRDDPFCLERTPYFTIPWFIASLTLSTRFNEAHAHRHQVILTTELTFSIVSACVSWSLKRRQHLGVELETSHGVNPALLLQSRIHTWGPIHHSHDCSEKRSSGVNTSGKGIPLWAGVVDPSDSVGSESTALSTIMCLP